MTHDDDDVRLSWMVFNDIMQSIADLSDLVKTLEVRVIEHEKTKLPLVDATLVADRWYFDY